MRAARQRDMGAASFLRMEFGLYPKSSMEDQ